MDLEPGQAKAPEHLINDRRNFCLVENIQLAVANNVDIRLVKFPEAAPLGPFAPVDLADLVPAEGEGQLITVQRHILGQGDGQIKAQGKIRIALLEAVDLLLGLAAALGQQDLASSMAGVSRAAKP